MKVGDLLKAVKKESSLSDFSLPKELPITGTSQRPISVKSTRAPPVFLAKRVNDEDLQDEKEEKPSSPQILMQILEEPPETVTKASPGKSQSHIEIEHEEEEANTVEKGKNIFELEMLHSTKYQEHSKGPVFENGKVVKHSIVGSVEGFERQLRKGQKAARQGQDSETSFVSNAESGIISTKNTRLSMAVGSLPDSSLPGLFGGSTNPTKKFFESKKREFRKIPKVPKQELMLQIDEFKQRQDKFYEDIARSVRTMKTADQLYLTKDERCLRKFDKTLDQWGKVVDQTSSRLKRPSSQSIISRGAEQRPKKEQADVLEMIKSDEERFGGNLWKMTLRHDTEGADRFATEEEYYHSRPVTGATTVRERPMTGVEVVRRPGTVTSQGGDTWRTSFFRTGTNAATDRSLRAYLQEKLKKGQSRLEVVKAGGDGIEQLQVLLG